MSENHIWTNECARKLVHLYEERRFLWDPMHPDYKDRSMKNRAWQEIADCFGLESKAAEMKMKIMVGQYRRELARLGNDRKSKWYAFSWLRFLPVPRHGQSYAHLGSPAADEEESAEASEEPATPTPEKSWRQPRRPTSSAKDHNTLYGAFVASKLRNLSSRHARSTAQYLIGQILYNAEMGEYDHIDGRRVRIVTEERDPFVRIREPNEPPRDRGAPDEDAASDSRSDCAKIKVIKIESM